MREWIKNRLPLEFESIVFNLNDAFFSLNRNGKVRTISADECMQSASSLALLDPCSLLNGMKLSGFKLLIVTSSASPLVGQSKAGCVLTEFLKEAKVHVMNPWTREELEKIMPNINEARFKQFSYRVGDTEYCIPRWMRYNDHEVEEKLSDSFTTAALEGITDWFLGASHVKHLNDPRMPLRLCVIERKGFGWGPTRFLSNYVTQRFSKWIQDRINVNRRRFLQFFTHPFTAGLVGAFFENWAFEVLGLQKRRLNVQIMDVSLNTNAPTKLGRPTKYIITPAKIPPLVYVGKDLDFFSWSTKDDSMSQENLRLEPGIIYKSKVPNNPSIDGYALLGNDLLMFQATVAKTHSDALWADVKHLVLWARGKNPNIRVFIVYLVPSDSSLQLPSCWSLVTNDVKVCRGTFDDDDFHTAYFESL